jgi:hypothetical protein
MANYTRNIQGHSVALELTDFDPDQLQLDTANPRLRFSIRQLPQDLRTDAACTLLLTSQEDVEELKRSIILSNGVQEPIYVRSNMVVAEGNRRVTAMRLAKEEYPDNPRFKSIPGWLIPPNIPESVIQDLLNEVHLGSVRGWAPYEKGLQLQALVNGGLIEEEVAERYRMTPREVKQHIAAVELMDREYFPVAKNPTDIEHRSKFSYFLEFEKNTKLQKMLTADPSLERRFAHWVSNGHIITGESVRRLPKILHSAEAANLLEVVGFDAAEDYLRKQYPGEHELYALFEQTRARLANMTITELHEIHESKERQQIVHALRDAVQAVLKAVDSIQVNTGLK